MPPTRSSEWNLTQDHCYEEPSTAGGTAHQLSTPQEG